MIIDGEYEEVESAEGELDLSAEDSLPWLEADEEDDEGSDNTHIIILGLIFFGITLAVVGSVWFFTSQGDEATLAADGSVIEAPEGPYKERPDDPGGKEFAGTGTVAPVVAEGGTPEGVLDTDGNANSGGDGDDGSDRASALDRSASASGATGGASGASDSSGAATGSSATGASASGVGVQLAAYSTRSRAEQGWSEISRRTDALSGLRYRIEEGVVDIGKVYRLQAVAGDRAAANRLCEKLKSDGIDCQVKG